MKLQYNNLLNYYKLNLNILKWNELKNKILKN